jgi:O-antigen/teichoic acid export membrane protein
MNYLKRTIKNKVISYILGRYATYFIQFINSLFIAVYLGPYYLGIWGFINLILQYLNQLNFGIPHSLNTIISIHKNREWYVQKVTGSALFMFIGLSLLACLFFIINELFFDIGTKYNFSKYALTVVITTVLVYINSIMATVFRVYGKLFEIAFSQTVFPVLMFVSILFFRGENLLWALVISNLLATFSSFLLYISRTPIKIKPLFIGRLFKYIQKKGWYLFIYNTSFYLILISTRSFVSKYYSVEEFGYFTFAFTMANVGLLLLESFSFIIYPKLLNRFASGGRDKIHSLLNLLRNVYITTSHLLIHAGIFCFPFFLYFFPQYASSKEAFYLIALTLALYTNSFGYAGLLIAKEQEKNLSYLALLSLVLNIVITFILINLFRLSFSQIILSTMISYLFFVFGIGYLGRKYLGLQNNIAALLQNIFPFQLFIPFMLSLCLIFFHVSSVYFVIPLFVFIFLSRKLIFNLKQTVQGIIFNSKFIDF